LSLLRLGDCEDIRKIYSILGRFASFRRPGAWLVDVVPWLENSRIYDFFSPWKKVADEIFEKDYAIYEDYFKAMKAKVEEGKAPHSWGKEFVQSDYARHGVDEAGAVYTAYLLFLTSTYF
jgi:hypothetical protein